MNNEHKDLEKELSDYYASASPNPEFISRLERGLHSKLKEKEKNKMFGKSVRLKWGLAFAALLIAFLVSPVGANALKRLSAYIPGMGVFEQSSGLRILEEPVSQTRDGITITIIEVVASAEKTVVAYRIENAPLPNDGNCYWGSALVLKDGSELHADMGSAEVVSDAEFALSGMGFKDVYPPIPEGEQDALWTLYCEKASGERAPGIWEFPLRLVVAPEDYAIPVMDVVSSSDNNPLKITSAVETETGYILIGEFRSSGLPSGAVALWLNEWSQVTDASGNLVEHEIASDLDLIPERGVVKWALDIKGKEFDFPLTVSFNSIVVEYPQEKTQFDFDAGENPQVGQVWNLNREFELAGHSIRLLSITRTENGYAFSFDREMELHYFDVEIANDNLSSRGGNSDESGYTVNVGYDGNVPSGKLTIILSNPITNLNGDWQIQWQP